jgi:ATP-dependent protease ClpP protease subunit
MIGRSARIMIHPISGGVIGNVFEAMNEIKEFTRLQDLMSNALLTETTMKKEEIDELMKSGHDCYLTPDQAVKLGIVDKIIGEK